MSHTSMSPALPNVRHCFKEGHLSIDWQVECVTSTKLGSALIKVLKLWQRCKHFKWSLTVFSKLKNWEAMGSPGTLAFWEASGKSTDGPSDDSAEHAAACLRAYLATPKHFSKANLLLLIFVSSVQCYMCN